MPLYEYRCRACGRRVEKLQKFSDDPLDTCETCGGELERLVSPPAIQFKGSGWYVTDYARKSSSPEPGSTTSSGAKSEGSSSKAESKSASPSPSKDKK